MKEETEFMLQCNTNSFIEQVMYSKKSLDTSVLLNKPLFVCLAPEYLEAGKEFFDRIRLADKAENYVLAIMLGEEKQLFSFSGVQLRSHIFIMAQPSTETLLPETRPATKNLLDVEVKAAVQNPETTVQEAGLKEKCEVSLWDLMEEMSRLNNELINTKRELTRKNLELERLQQQLKKG